MPRTELIEPTPVMLLTISEPPTVYQCGDITCPACLGSGMKRYEGLRERGARACSFCKGAGKFRRYNFIGPTTLRVMVSGGAL